MKAIILAAGAGRRLGLDYPKCLAEVGGQSIIHRQLAAFHAGGIDEYILVTGFKQDLLRRNLAGEPGQFSFIVNDRYQETNTLYSLYLARQHLAEGFFYANADVVFDRRLVDLLAASSDPTVLACRFGPCGQEDVKVAVQDHRVFRIGKTLTAGESAGEFLGLARFGADLCPAFIAALSRCLKEENAVHDYFERAVDCLCPDHRLAALDVGDLPCCEVDFPADLVVARNQVAPLLWD